jgi:hypothetical protein
MSESAFERRLRRASAKLPPPIPEAQSQLERYQQIEAALATNTASEEDFRWIFDNIDGVAAKVKSGLLDKAEILLGDKFHWRFHNFLETAALKILTTPLGSEIPDDAYSVLEDWAGQVSWKPVKGLELLCEATHRLSIRAIYLVSALGSPDGLPLRQELARRGEGSEM